MPQRNRCDPARAKPRGDNATRARGRRFTFIMKHVVSREKEREGERGREKDRKIETRGSVFLNELRAVMRRTSD